MDASLALGLIAGFACLASEAAMRKWPQSAWLVSWVFWGSIVAAVGCLGYWAYSNQETVMAIFRPTYLIAVGLVLSLIGLVWLHVSANESATQAAASPSAGEGGGKGASVQSDAPWNEEARLTLNFDGELQTATASRQEGVRFYYWYHFPSVAIDYENKQARGAVGYVMVFMALKDPTHTNYNRVRAVGGGVLCEVMSAHAAGAVIRAMGDMRGRTLDIWFSKEPIPVD